MSPWSLFKQREQPRTPQKCRARCGVAEDRAGLSVSSADSASSSRLGWAGRGFAPHWPLLRVPSGALQVAPRHSVSLDGAARGAACRRLPHLGKAAVARKDPSRTVTKQLLKN